MSGVATALALLAAACFAVPAWVYLGYPLLLLLRRAAGTTPILRGDSGLGISVIVPAHDEERVLGEKLDNLLAADGAGSAEVLVASDGSTDRSVAIASERARSSPSLRVLDLERVGKARALDAAVNASSGAILVFTDANALWERESLRELLSPFADPDVGGVAGVQLYRRKGGSGAVGEGESAYWQWDTWLKQLESDIHSCYAADGSLYAVRRELYVPVADPAQADDMAISMRVVLQGRRLVLAPGAVAWEDAPQDPSREFARKARVTNHSMRSLLLLGPSLWRSGWYSVVLVSHKLLRHLTPFFLVAGLALSLLAAPFSGFARWLLVPQALVYGFAALGWLVRGLPLGRLRILLVPWYFCLANAAAFAGSLRALRGQRITSWTHDRKSQVPPDGAGS